MSDEDGTKNGGKKVFRKDAAQDSYFPVVGIGASAGGLDALKELFEHLPPDEVSCVVVQHLDPSHESLLAEILSKRTQMKVLEATDGAKPGVNCVYTIPPRTFITVADGVLRLAPRTESPGLFMPIDEFFRSLAKNYGDRAIGIVLSGAGTDGALGLQEIKEFGGTTFAQDEDSAQFYSMPHSAVATGAVDFVLPPKGIAEQLAKFVRQKFWAGLEKHRTTNLEPSEGNELNAILRLIHKNTGIDFSSYKTPTLSRRIVRRMGLRRIERLSDYAQLLKKDAEETKALSQDILIQVTKFFRDEASFDFLKEKIFPKLVKDRVPNDPIRVWVPGCSSGEELFSILILLTEYMADTECQFPVQFFGTDINETAIDKARAGAYMESALVEVSHERLRRFFTKTGTRYEIIKSLRDVCIFAKHNILTDPPFARLDLISCQNVLIYFDTSLQKRALSIFHYALKPSGFLVLGRAETVAANPDLYAYLKSGAPFFRKVAASSRLYFDFATAHHAAERMLSPGKPHAPENEMSKGIQLQKEIERLVMSEYAPPGVVFNDRLEVVQFRGSTGPYFEHSPGSASLELLKMLKGGLISEVSTAIKKTREKGERVRKEGIKLRSNGHTSRIAIELLPINVPPSGERFFYLVFEDMDAPAFVALNKRRAAKKAEELDDAEDTAALRAELTSTKEYLRSINEERQAVNEELRAANEEIMSSNEELQSTNEELHSAKEELQSSNEELMTVNEELQHRNRDLSQLNNDLNNLFAGLDAAVVMLNKELRVRKFTPMAEKLLRLIPADIGRSINDIKPRLEIEDLRSTLEEVLSSMVPKRFDARDGEDGRWYSVHVRPYRTSDDKIDGVVLLFQDIHEMKASLEYAKAFEEALGQPLVILSGDLKVRKANDKFYKTFGMAPNSTEGQFFYELGNGEWNLAELRRFLEEVLPKNTTMNDFELTQQSPGNGTRRLRLSARCLSRGDKGAETILLAFDLG